MSFSIVMEHEEQKILFFTASIWPVCLHPKEPKVVAIAILLTRIGELLSTESGPLTHKVCAPNYTSPMLIPIYSPITSHPNPRFYNSDTHQGQIIFIN